MDQPQSTQHVVDDTGYDFTAEALADLRRDATVHTAAVAAYDAIAAQLFATPPHTPLWHVLNEDRRTASVRVCDAYRSLHASNEHFDGHLAAALAAVSA